jgi:DNA repair protein RecO (recombination protein O)
MITSTQGIVLRSVKYGETSLISSIFTRTYGVQSYMVQGVRSARSRQHKAVMLQPASLIDMVIYQKPRGSLHRIREMHFAHVYARMQEEVTRNSIALFSAELLLRLLPEHAPQPELFDFAKEYFVQLDTMEAAAVANFPLYFLIQCTRHLGYAIGGSYSEETPYLDLHDGAYSAHPPKEPPFIEREAAQALSALIPLERYENLAGVSMNAGMRFHLIEWYLAFLHRHTQHMSPVKSLQVLQAVLH